MLESTRSVLPGANHYNKSDYLLDSPFTTDWLLQTLNTKDDNFKRLIDMSKVNKVTTVNISEGKGYLSKVYKISINFEGSDEPYEVLMKVPGKDAMLNLAKTAGTNDVLDSVWVAEAHNRECQFYNEYAPQIADVPMIKVYAAQEMNHSHGVLLMESMLLKAELCPIWESANEVQIFSLAKHLSSLYAHFLCLPYESWGGRYVTNTLTDFFTSEFFYSHIDKLADLKPGVFDEGIKVFRKYVSSRKFYNYAMTDVHKDVGLPPILSHGDVWSNNLLWTKNPDGTLSNELAALIDWQLIHEGCITHDITAFMVLSVDGNIRREYQYKVLRFMYDKIVQLLDDRGKRVEFSYDQMRRAYRTNMVAQAAQMLILPSFIFSRDGLSEEEAKVAVDRQQRFMLRVQCAVEDGLECLKEVPKDRIE